MKTAREELLKCICASEPIEAWGKKYSIREFTGKQRSVILKIYLSANASNQQDLVLQVRDQSVAFALCDENGERIFTDDAKELEVVGSLPSRDLDLVSKAILKMNGFADGSAIDDAKKS